MSDTPSPSTLHRRRAAALAAAAVAMLPANAFAQGQVTTPAPGAETPAPPAAPAPPTAPSADPAGPSTTGPAPSTTPPGDASAGTVAAVPANRHAPTARRAFVARVILPTVARRDPRAGARIVSRVSPYGPYDRDPQSLLVLGSARTGSTTWYRVQLPIRPNGTSGWVRADALQVTATPMRLRVDISERTLTMMRADRVLATWPVAVGTVANPTPRGLFSVSEIVPQTPATGFFGPYIITLTAHSERLSDFDGGTGQVAIHGTSLPGLLGRAVSHGCVRMGNGEVTRVATGVPRGAPVEIVD